jgi:hypothetical protein
VVSTAVATLAAGDCSLSPPNLTAPLLGRSARPFLDHFAQAIDREVPTSRDRIEEDARFVETVVPDRRIVYVYEMWINGEYASVSIATIEIVPDTKGTRLVITEAGAFFGSQDDAMVREQGTNLGADDLGASLPPS